MLNALRILAAACLLAVTASLTNAAPVNVGQEPGGVSNALVQIYGGHRSCERGPRAGIAIIDTGNGAIVANGVAKGVALTTASGSVGSTSATTELRVAGFGRPRAPDQLAGISPELAFPSVDGADASANLARPLNADAFWPAPRRARSSL
jgi:hypothetical protein